MEAPPVDQLRQQNIPLETEKLIDQGNLPQAEQALKIWLAAHQANPEKNQRTLELARVLFWRGKPTESKGTLEQVLQANPNESWATSFLGQVEVKLGNHAVARKLFEDALKQNPTNHEALMFVEGDLLDQVGEVKRLLTHGQLSFRDRIRAEQLCQAIDFKRGKTVDFEKGPITSQMFTRANLMMDEAKVGEEVDSETTLRQQFNEAQEVVYYTSNAFGDAILGLAAVDAMAKYFQLHPDKTKPIEIVTPYTDVFAGLADKYAFVRLKKSGKSRDANEAQNYAADLQARTKKTFALTNAGSETYDALRKAKPGSNNVVMDAFVDRFSRDLEPWTWQASKSPYEPRSSYPTRMYRFIEMALGEKLTEEPSKYAVDIPLSQAGVDEKRRLSAKYKLTPAGQYHCVVESASQISKKFAPDQLRDIVTGMVNHCKEQQKARGTDVKVIFIKDPGATDSFATQIAALPQDVREHIVVAQESLQGVQALVDRSETVLSPDTGIGHLAGAMGKKTFMIYTMADPYLWNTGGQNVDFLASQQARMSHDNQTPVNMVQWNENRPITAEAFSAQQILDRWKSMTTTATPRAPLFSFLGRLRLRE